MNQVKKILLEVTESDKAVAQLKTLLKLDVADLEKKENAPTGSQEVEIVDHKPEEQVHDAEDLVEETNLLEETTNMPAPEVVLDGAEKVAVVTKAAAVVQDKTMEEETPEAQENLLADDGQTKAAEIR